MSCRQRQWTSNSQTNDPSGNHAPHSATWTPRFLGDGVHPATPPPPFCLRSFTWQRRAITWVSAKLANRDGAVAALIRASHEGADVL